MGMIASNRRAGSGEYGPVEPACDNCKKLLAKFQELGEGMHMFEEDLRMFREDMISQQNRVRRILLDRGGEDATGSPET